MSETILTHPVLAAAIAALSANIFVAGVVYGLSATGQRQFAQLDAWRRRTFTTAGDECVDCRRWQLPVACLSCGRTRVLTATQTIPTDGRAAAAIATARARREADRRVGAGEEQRRRAAIAFDEIDFDLDDQAVN